jgi:hypothetical protein
VAEALLSGGIIGVMYAVLAGQPLVILGVTGPVALSYWEPRINQLAEEVFDANYFAFFAWTCIWAGLLHIHDFSVFGNCGIGLFGLHRLHCKFLNCLLPHRSCIRP